MVREKIDDKRKTKPYNIHNNLKDMNIQLYGKMKSWSKLLGNREGKKR